MGADKIWIAWETQKRSITLAKHFNCKLLIFDIEGIFRYPLCVFKTLFCLLYNRPKLLFVQNPSMALAALACFYCSFSNTKLVIDRHTTFRLNKPHSGSLSIWLFMRFHYYTLKHAHLTIVTNSYLADLVIKAQGRPAILPDKLPDLPSVTYPVNKKSIHLLLISSFGLDEPINETIEAFKLLNNPTCTMYITGNYKKRLSELPQNLPENLILTGYIPESDYYNLLQTSDIVLVLTKADYCMLCGCYEAISAEKPLITSDKEVLRNYFKEALFVDNSTQGILKGITEVLQNIDIYNIKSKSMKRIIEKEWSYCSDTVQSSLDALLNIPDNSVKNYIPG